MKPAALAVGLACALLLTSGCARSRDEAPPASSEAPVTVCAKREDCPKGQLCSTDNRCEQCRTSGQCGLKEECKPETFLCGLRKEWGEECLLNDQCQAGQFCHQGFCRERQQVNLCPSGDSDCPSKTRCHPQNQVCEEDLGCALDSDCSAAEVCNTGLSACVARCTTENQAQVCGGLERCVNGKCAQCATDAECAAGTRCDAAGRCSTIDRCYTTRDCAVPLSCHVPTGACLPQAPPCASDDSCADGERCDLANGKCVPRSCQPDRFEPNNARPSASSATPGRYEFLTLCPQDVDTYAVFLARGDQLGVNVDADPYAEDAFSTVIQDREGRALASGKLLASYVAPSGGTYYVQLRTTDAFHPYDLTLLLSRGIPCDDDNLEPNDTPAAARPLNAQGELTGIICPQDQDHFSLFVPDDRTAVRVSLFGYDSSQGLLRLCLLEGDQVRGCTDAPTNPQVLLTQASGKSLLVRVTGDQERTRNGYGLRVTYE